MDFFTTAAIIITLSALFGYINVKVLKMPNTIGLMVIAIVFTVLLFVSKYMGNAWFYNQAKVLVGGINFQEVLMNIMLGFLLFAGAMHTNFDQLRVQRWPVLVFATLGVLASTLIVAGVVYFLFPILGQPIEWIPCLLFGALISPTDPIAVLGILKKAGVPKKLETKIVGESLFNDGVGVVVFLTIMSIATGGAHGHAGHGAPALENANSIALVSYEAEEDGHAAVAEESAEEVSVMGKVGGVLRLFFQEVFGGVVFGLAIGYLTFRLLRSIDDYEIEVMITLACVMGGYSLAHYLGFSAPLAIVVAGLIVGNDTVRGTSMSSLTEEYVDKFWELVDMLLNAILFVLIGLEMLLLDFSQTFLICSLVSIVVVLVARYVSLLVPVAFFKKRLNFTPHTSTIMAWGGLRGGISIALALSIPHDMAARDLLVTVTYGVVIFSIIVQGLTVGKLAKALIGSEAMENPEATGAH